MLESALAMVERIVYESLEKHQSGLVGGGGRLRFDAQTNALLLDDDEEDIPEDAVEGPAKQRGEELEIAVDGHALPSCHTAMTCPRRSAHSA